MIPKSLVKRVLARDHGMCVIAGPPCTRDATVADHRVNRGHGGSKVLNDLANLIAACGLCNGWKEDVDGEALIELRRRGVRVQPDSTHAKSLLRAQITPVEYPNGMVVILTSSGDRLEQVLMKSAGVSIHADRKVS